MKLNALKSSLLALAVFLLAAPRLEGDPNALVVQEASGVARWGEWLLIADDDELGAYLRYPLRGEEGPEIPIDPERVQRVPLPGANVAADLEAIDVLADGRVAALSERSRSLFCSEGLIAEYGPVLGEFGKRGLEGLAVHELPGKASRIAVVWEGGYPEFEHLPELLRQRWDPKPLIPIIQVHHLAPQEMGLRVHSGHFITLDLPSPPEPQRFRAPDLVWHRMPDGAWGFIVLLSSQWRNGRARAPYHWLQRFAADGRPVGPRLDLSALLPKKLRGRNWEGMDWFEEGESLVVVHESTKDRTSAFVVQLPEDWTDQRVTRRFSHVVRGNAGYFENPPDRKSKPDGALASGTHVSVIETDGEYCMVQTETNEVIYVARKSLKENKGAGKNGKAQDNPEGLSR